MLVLPARSRTGERRAVAELVAAADVQIRGLPRALDPPATQRGERGVTTDVEIYDSKVEALALALAGDANRDRADAKAVLMIDGAIAYLAARFGIWHVAE